MKLHAIARLVTDGSVIRYGLGKAKDPFFYAIAVRS
jgi:hypothetical protein